MESQAILLNRVVITEAESRILVVEDNAVNRLLLEETLLDHGFDVMAVADGNEALSRVVRYRPCLILLDIMMPGIDGFEVMSLLRDDAVFRDTPVIFLTALTDRADRLKGLELGAVDYITKPFDQNEVLVKVRNQVRIQQLSASLKAANARLLIEQERVHEDLKAAREIQASLLPKHLPASSRLKFDACMRPCFEVGGDLFGIQRTHPSLVALYAIDVSGHGTAAAMVTMSIAQTIARIQQADPSISPRAMFEQLDAVYPLERFGRFFTIAYALFDEETGTLTYSTAGHPWPFWYRQAANGQWLDQGGTVIGVGGPLEYEEGTVVLEPGDRIYFYSDGLIETGNQRGDQFGRDRLEAILHARSREDLQGIAHKIIDSVVAWSGEARLNDDLSVMAIALEG